MSENGFGSMWCDVYVEFSGKLNSVQYVNWIFVVMYIWVVDQVDFYVFNGVYVVGKVSDSEVSYFVVYGIKGKVVLFCVFFNGVKYVVVDQLFLFVLFGVV